MALVLHLGGVGECERLIWEWSVHSQESGDLQDRNHSWVGIWIVLSDLYTPFVAAVSFLFMDRSCASFSICFIFASQSGFPSARDRSCAIWWSHFIRASALDFCVVHKSSRSLVTSFRISFVGRSRICIGFTFIFSERFSIDVVSGACQFLQSRMFL
jgi:hypothetical protein